MKTFFFTILAPLTFSSFLVPNVFAQSEPPCGNIIAPADWRIWQDRSRPIQSVPIDDCEDPFLKTDDLVELKISGLDVINNVVIEIPEGGTSDYRYDAESAINESSVFYFRHTEDNYQYVDTSYKEPTAEQFEQAALNFFGNQSDADRYLVIYRSNDPYEYFYDEANEQYEIDETTGETIEYRYFKFVDYLIENLVTDRPKLTAGTYTAVTVYVVPILSYEENIFKKVLARVIPTAHAQYIVPDVVSVVTFTLQEVTPEPVGASSVLFLPGIMGSRLYEDSDACGGSGEQERWFSVTDCSQLRLLMNTTGVSVNTIYTKEGPTAIIDETLSFNLYKTFLKQLNNWKNDGMIVNYAAVPYDWRLRLDDILKTKLDSNGKVVYDVTADYRNSSLYKTLKALVASSATGKVTIVTHSNGGLLAKVFLRTLELRNDPLVTKIDSIIMVAAPQVGTPDALIGLLHGTELGPQGVIVSQATTRRLMNTMPFSYHLLPNSHYFGSESGTVFTPVIRFESGTSTASWLTTYGSEIKDTAKMYAFLRRDSGRAVPTVSDLLTPQVVDNQFLDYAQVIETLQAGWQPASTTKLYQIAGTGIETPSGITYFTDRECAARSLLRLFVCTGYRSKLGYRVNMVQDGDGTVVVPSALVKSEDGGRVKRWWLDMGKYNNDVIADRDHKNIFEVPDVINFIGNTLESTTSRPYIYLSNTIPVLSPSNRLSFYLHSPLDMSIRLANGNELSSSTQTINGGIYRRYGELQYISLPDTTATKTLVLFGKATGSFTLDIEQQKNGSTTSRQTYSAIPSSTSTKVTVVLSDSNLLPQTVLVVDYDGNGTTDINYDVEGIVYNYAILKVAIQDAVLRPIFKRILLETAKTAELNYQKSLTQPQFKSLERFVLQVLKQTIGRYEKSKLLSPAESARLIEIINGLLNR